MIAATAAAAVLLVPAAGARAELGSRARRAPALAELLALARFAAAAAAWDVGNGFSLMGASRELSISVFVEATLVLSLAVAALVAGTTDLRGVVEATAGTGVWSRIPRSRSAVSRSPWWSSPRRDASPSTTRIPTSN